MTNRAEKTAGEIQVFLQTKLQELEPLTTEETELLVDVMLAWGSAIGQGVDSKFTFCRTAQLRWDDAEKRAKKKGTVLEELARLKQNPGPMVPQDAPPVIQHRWSIHPRSVRLSGLDPFIRVLPGDVLAWWQDRTVHYEVTVVGFTNKRIRVRLGLGPDRTISLNSLGMLPDHLNIYEAERRKAGNRDTPRLGSALRSLLNASNQKMAKRQ